jgi:heme O synthase-like polyprenyltransferase
MLPVVEPDGVSTRRRIVAYSFALVAVTLVPTLTRMSGPAFGILALGLGLLVIGQSFRIAVARELHANREAHRMLLATVAYLPVLMIAIVLDHAM